MADVWAGGEIGVLKGKIIRTVIESSLYNAEYIQGIEMKAAVTTRFFFVVYIIKTVRLVSARVTIGTHHS